MQDPSRRPEPVKRVRPRNPAACTRCKNRKQRCDLIEGSASCRNCLDSAAECVFAPRPDNGKRRRAIKSAAEDLPQISQAALTSTPYTFSESTPSVFLPGGGIFQSDIPIPFNDAAEPYSSYSAPNTVSSQLHLPMPTNLRQHRPAESGPTSPQQSQSPGAESSAFSDDSVESAAKGVAYVTLEASAEPHYLGPSSGFQWSKMILHGMAGAENASKKPEHKSTGYPATRQNAVYPDIGDAAPIPTEIATLVIEAVYRHVQPRYPFLDWVALHDEWQGRDEILRAAKQKDAAADTSASAFFILMILAIGSQLCNKLNLPNIQSPDCYYAQAMPYLDVLVQMHNLKNVQALLLMAIYSLRNSHGPSVWYLTGVSIRLCVGMGLHRRLNAQRRRYISSYEEELRKRIFWTTYVLDRMMALSLGRPVGVADQDIDVDLPENINCVDTVASCPSQGNTSMSSAIHHIKLKRIESLIQRTIYRVDDTVIQPETVEEILRKIGHWEEGIPSEAATEECWNLPCCSRDWFLLKSAEVRLYLLRPLTIQAETSNRVLLVELAQSAALAADIQKRIHRNGQPLSSSSLHSIFLGGLTLLHAVHTDPTVMPHREVSKAVRATSNALFAYSQQFKIGEVLHEAFEDLASASLERLANPPAVRNQPILSDQDTNDWQDELARMSSTMNMSMQNDFTNLLESFGVPITATAPAPTSFEPFPEAVGFDSADPFPLDYLFNMAPDAYLHPGSRAG